MSVPISPTFCALPWVHSQVRPSGKLYACCYNLEELEGARLTADLQSLANAWNSEGYRKIRRELLAGERPKGCERCFKMEDLGVTSDRQYANDRHSHKIEQVIAHTAPDGRVPAGLYSVNLFFDNKCNLKCRMCSPAHSQLLAKEWQALGYDAADSVGIWQTDEEWKYFFESNPDLYSLTIAGGEPLISPRALWVLDYLIETGRAAEMNLLLDTNLTSFPDFWREKLSRFRSVDLRVSLDGVGAVNSFIRYPSSWERLEENIRKLNEFAVYPFVSARFSITLQAYNIGSFSQVLHFSAQFKNLNAPTLHFLRLPQELRFQVLPEEYRRIARARLEEFLRDCDTVYTHRRAEEIKCLREDVRGVMHLLSEENEEQLFPEFVKRTQRTDALRGHSIAQYIPEVAALFAPENRRELEQNL